MVMAPDIAKPPQIVVTAPDLRSIIKSIPPVRTLTSGEILGYNADTVGELLDDLDADAHPSGTDKPLIMMNGKLVDRSAIAGLPPEALDGAEILQANDATRLGGNGMQRLINIIVKHHYRGAEVTITGGTSTEGGGRSAKAATKLTLVNENKVSQVWLSYKKQQGLRESQRGIQPTPALAPFDFVGNVVGAGGGSIDPALDSLAGVPVKIAGVPGPHPTLADFVATANRPRQSDVADMRSLTLASEAGNVRINLMRPLGGTQISIDASLDASRSHGVQGPATALLGVPSGDPFSPFGAPILVERFLNEVRPLQTRKEQLVAFGSANIGGHKGGILWTALADYTLNYSRQANDTGINLAPVQAALSGDSASVDPFAALPVGLLGGRLRNQGTSTSQTITGSLMISAPLMRIAEWSLRGTLKLDTTQNWLASRNSIAGGPTVDMFTRYGSSGGDFSLSLPVQPFRAFGQFVLEGGVGARRVSDFHVLTDYHYGLGWTPSSNVSLNVNMASVATAPPASSLAAPEVTTPNVPIFDYVRGQSALVSLISGGNPSLLPARSRSMVASLLIIPARTSPWRFTLDYRTTSTNGQASALPGVTAAVEQAFPERFVRAPDGTLLSLDNRPINIDREESAEWGSEITYSHSFGKTAEPVMLGPGSHDSDDKASNILRFSLSQTWRLKDAVRIRQGLPLLDLLSGATLGGNGLSRHTVEASAGGNMNGLGFSLAGHWKSGTRVQSADPASALRFSGLFTADVGLIANLGQMRAFRGDTWMKNLRITFNVVNVADSRMRVRNGLGVTPLNYQPGYLDPLGRTISLTIRKLF